MNSIRFLFINHTIDLSDKAGWIIRPGFLENVPLTYLDLLVNRSDKNEPAIKQRFGKSFDAISPKATILLAGYNTCGDTTPGRSFLENTGYGETAGNLFSHSKGIAENYNLIVVDQFMSLSTGLNISAKLRQYETMVSPGDHIRIFALASVLSEEQILRMWNEGISFQACHTFRTANTIEILRELQIFENHMKF
ncbi:MAG: hypothetical protein JXA03_05050 [Bacteroidales bacterium]|nr:hypothetical protein [Bacteroidales bacterium]